MENEKETQVIMNNLKDVTSMKCAWQYEKHTEYKNSSKILQYDDRNEELNIKSGRKRKGYLWKQNNKEQEIEEKRLEKRGVGNSNLKYQINGS